MFSLSLSLSLPPSHPPSLSQNVLAANITQEQGKTLPDAEGDVTRGLQVVEHCCSITSLQLGETLGSVTKDMDTYSYREPLGVCAGVTPFNFPAMIPLWVSLHVQDVSLDIIYCKAGVFVANISKSSGETFYVCMFWSQY